MSGYFEEELPVIQQQQRVCFSYGGQFPFFVFLFLVLLFCFFA